MPFLGGKALVKYRVLFNFLPNHQCAPANTGRRWPMPGFRPGLTRQEYRMTREASNADLTLALNTTLEREFVSPLTSIRGVLEILRDFPDLGQDERERFLANALDDCARLEQGIDQLAATVYAAAERERAEQTPPQSVAGESEYADRIHLLPELQIVEVDFSDLEFSNSRLVNEFYDLLERIIENTGQRWYLLVNYRKCSVWPEAWVAFAHRGKKVNVNYALGTVRYYDSGTEGEDSARPSDPELLGSRDAALARIDELRRSSTDR
jgi:hypothetical protein